MTYEQIIQQVGKSIEKQVYYYVNNTKTDVAVDNITEVKICFNSDITGTIMKKLELTLKEKINPDKIYVKIVAKFGEYTQSKTYGPYYLKETTYNADEKTYVHECYDYILNTMVDYKKITLTYPTTIQTYFNALVNQLGMTSSISLVNGSITLGSDIYDGINYTYRDVLQDIAEANGICMYVDETEIKEVVYGTESVTINDDILKNTNIDFGEHYGPINVLVLSRSADSDNIYYPSTLPSDPCEYKIRDNQLMNDNNRASFMAGIYSKISNKGFDLFDTELVGYGGFIPFQKVYFETGGNTYTSYVFNNEIDITDGYAESIYTEEPSYSQTDYSYADTTDKRINETYLIVDKQNQSINGVISQIGEQNEKLVEISADIDELNSKIQEVADITTSGETSYASLSLENVNESEPIYIKVFPTTKNISYLYPYNGLYPSNSLYSSNRILRFTNTSKNETFDYKIPDDLLIYDSENYDEFILDYGLQTCTVNKKCGYDSNGNVVKLSSMVTKTYDYPEIKLTDGNYTITLLGYSNGYINARLMASNIYTSQFATKIEMNSAITQTARNINLSVDEKLENYSNTTTMQSKIDVSATNILSTVSNTYATKDTTNSLSSRIDQTATSITSEVSRATTAENNLSDDIQAETTRATTSESDMSSRINQTAKEISLTVNNGSTSSGITITTTKEDGTTETSNGTITMNGLVKFTDLSTSGSTTINGANIQTGTLSASKITTGNLSASRISGGTFNGDNMTIKNLSADSITTGTLNGRAITNGTITGATYKYNGSNKTITINDDNDGGIYGYYTGGSSSALSSSNMRFNLTSWASTGRLTCWGSSGTSGGYYYFNNTGPHASSDIRFKKNISNIQEDVSMNIITNLNPIEYRFIDEDIYHRGLSAQEIESVLNANNIENEIYDYDKEIDRYTVNYVELIPDLINCIKYQQKQIEDLKRKIGE